MFITTEVITRVDLQIKSNLWLTAPKGATPVKSRPTVFIIPEIVIRVGLHYLKFPK